MQLLSQGWSVSQKSACTNKASNPIWGLEGHAWSKAYCFVNKFTAISWLSTLGRKKAAILLKDQENMERPSDIQGLIYIPLIKRKTENLGKQ